MKSPFYLLFRLAILLPVICPTQGAAQTAGEESREFRGGYPLAATRRTAIDSRPFQRPLEESTIRKWIELSSQCTMAEFALFLAPLSESETRLLEHIERVPVPIINRLPFEDLRSVLKNGGLCSLNRLEELRAAEVTHTTPAVENELYGADDFVFASIGPPHGSPRYGDVIIRIRDSVREHGWATPFSGMDFVYAVRHKDARKMQEILAGGRELPAPPSPLSLGFDDRLHFSHYVVTEKVWNKALAYQAILVLRNLDDSTASDRVRARFEQMLVEADPDKFWALFIPAREQGIPTEEAAARIPFGYLEGKFANQLAIADFTSIEVPALRLQEVRSWPEAQPYLQRIGPKPPGVP